MLAVISACSVLCSWRRGVVIHKCILFLMITAWVFYGPLCTPIKVNNKLKQKMSNRTVLIQSSNRNPSSGWSVLIY